MKRVALLLGGGTALGAVQVYPIERVIAECVYNGWSLSCVEGVSVGAQHAPLVAQGREHRIRHLWSKITSTRSFMRPNWEGMALALLGLVVRLLLWPLAWLGFVEDRERWPLQGLTTLKPIRKLALPELSHPILVKCRVGVVDYEDGPQYRSVSLEGLRPVARMAAMLASSAQPILMTGWRIGGYLGFDGGIKHVIPLLEDWRDYDRIYVVACTPVARLEKATPSEVNGIGEVAMRSVEAWTDSAFAGDIERLRMWANAGKEVILIAPLESAGDPFDASPETNQFRMDVLGPILWKNRTQILGIDDVH